MLRSWRSLQGSHTDSKGDEGNEGNCRWRGRRSAVGWAVRARPRPARARRDRQPAHTPPRSVAKRGRREAASVAHVAVAEAGQRRAPCAGGAGHEAAAAQLRSVGRVVRQRTRVTRGARARGRAQREGRAGGVEALARPGALLGVRRHVADVTRHTAASDGCARRVRRTQEWAAGATPKSACVGIPHKPTCVARIKHAGDAIGAICIGVSRMGRAGSQRTRAGPRKAVPQENAVEAGASKLSCPGRPRRSRGRPQGSMSHPSSSTTDVPTAHGGVASSP
jgi:hypothetical protein